MPAHILIAEDRMTAWLELGPGESCAVPRLRELLAAAGVVHGLQREALVQAGADSPEARSLVVARGDPPEPGLDGRIEVVVDVHAQPVRTADGTVAPHATHRFADVEAGQPLAKAVPPTPGRPGCRIDGTPVPPVPGKEADLAPWAGDGVVRGEGGCLAAGPAGVCSCRKAVHGLVLSVSTILALPGDVDLQVGDLDTRFPVEVAGDIRAGYVVKSAATITVRGVIEDARVSAAGTIRAGGILKGANRVKARGDLIVRHIAERTVKCRSLAVANGLVGAQVFALGHVHANDIVGGRIMCAGSVTCDRLGDELGTPTHLHVGVDPYQQALFADASEARDKALFALQETEERCRTLSARVQQGAAAHRHDVASLAAELRRQLAERDRLQAELARCDQVMAQHAERVKATRTLVEHARITVARIIHPGVTVVFGDQGSLSVREPMRGALLTCRDGRIVA